MNVKITVPDYFMGEILGDINKRRGRILGTETEEGLTVITVEAPQAELLKYAIDLRSMTQGRGNYISVLDRYEEVPPQIQEKIIAEARNS